MSSSSLQTDCDLNLHEERVHTKTDDPIQPQEDQQSHYEEIALEDMPPVLEEVVIDGTTFQEGEYFNGGIFETYCWSQSLTELDIYILLPENITKSNEIDVKVAPTRVTVKERKGGIILEGELYEKCRSSETLWLISGKKLQITLEKVKERWWHRLLDSEPLIDAEAIDEERSYAEMSEDLVQSMERAQWSRQQMMNGLPNEEEIQRNKRLRQAWDSEGSPFRGTPFDPSSVQFS